jgi:hypothetical protein
MPPAPPAPPARGGSTPGLPPASEGPGSTLPLPGGSVFWSLDAAGSGSFTTPLIAPGELDVCGGVLGTGSAGAGFDETTGAAGVDWGLGVLGVEGTGPGRVVPAEAVD